ncbi:MAG: glycosyl hydrolase family 95 catalytic domain-containing protein [Christensenellales bacterium]|jgi:alpha-L-fucosidase 2
MSECAFVADSPAADWAESFPVGNGRVGAMVRGQPLREIICLNHDLLWRGSFSGPHYRTGRDKARLLELCAQKKWDEADALLREMLPSQGGIYTNPFVPFCDLYVNLLPADGQISEYRRTLYLEHGIARTEYTVNGSRIALECFCAAVPNLFALKISASVPTSLCGEISLSRMRDAECKAEGEATYRALHMRGEFDEERRFAAELRIIHRGGRTTIGRRQYAPEPPVARRHFGLGYSFDRDEDCDAERGPSLMFDSCDELIVLVALSTDRESDDPSRFARAVVESAVEYEELRLQSAERFAEHFNRTRLYTGEIQSAYDMARYLAIASGMPQPEGYAPKAPINLQGLWCRDTWPAWDSDYHLDLNIQMCYWPLAQAGLLPWYEPFIAWMERLLPQAKACAEGLYGAKGAAYSGCCDPWILGGCDNVGYGFLGAGAWLAQILWIYYEYAPSDDLLRRIYNLMQPIAEFARSMLVRGEDGYLTYPYGASPEMGAVTETGTRWIGPAAVCDLLLTKELFEHMAAAGAPEYGELAKALRPVLVNGEIGEWIEQQQEAEPGHRHRSPFICFCPGNSVTRDEHQELTSALLRLFERRRDAGDGMSAAFSHAWDAQIAARFGQGERALECIQKLLRTHRLANGTLAINDHAGAVGLGWFRGIKVFQIEASIALIAAVTEMICQDHNGYIELLPALPDSLPDGRIEGLCVRGGFILDIAWQGKKPQHLSIYAPNGGECKVRIPPDVSVCSDCECTWDDGIVTLHIAPGKTIRIEFNI